MNPDIEKILSINSDAAFNSAALELFRFQARECQPYAEYLSLIGVEPASVDSLANVPFMPIELFKHRKVYCSKHEPQILFTSSNTGGTQPSCHYMEDVSVYEKTFTCAFEQFYGSPEEISIYGLLPNYLQREGSSLVYMVDQLIAQNRHSKGGFFLDNYDQLIEALRNDNSKKILLGVSYALWDLAEQFAPKLDDCIIMETGGMKGRREELPKDEFHKLLETAFGVSTIHSEYGMAELTSQAYSHGAGIFQSPAWMRVITRNINDPFSPSDGRRGGINIVDLANIHSCAFIQTEDIGSVAPDYSFTIEGRIDHSEIRGCNLLVY